MDQKQIIAERIKLLRNEKGLTQKQLADMTGISYKSIINYENAYREPNNIALKTFESFFDVSGAYLRGETELRNLDSVWDDLEIIDAVDQQMYNLLIQIINTSKITTPKNKKMTFDILVELRHILNLKDEQHKEITLDLLQNHIFSLTRFVDIYHASINKTEFEIGRLTRAKDLAVNSLSDSLDKMIDQLKELD